MRRWALPGMVVWMVLAVLGATAATGHAQLEAVVKGGSAFYRGLDVNIQDGDHLGRLYLAFEVQCISEEAAQAAASSLTREALILYLRGKQAAELRSPAGIRLLKKELVAVINKTMGAPRAVRVYLTQFVVR